MAMRGGAGRARGARPREHLAGALARSQEIRDWGYRLICGLDEVGRGALAGPVAAGAVVLAGPLDLPGLDDSKLLTPLQRRRLSPLIVRGAAASAVGYAQAWEVDRLGIAAATALAMRRALARLGVEPDHLLLDAFPLAGVPWPQLAREKGDRLFQEVAAASVVAKVQRDALMERLAERYPGYGWAENKGYGSQAHLQAIARLGLTPWHRRSFCHGVPPAPGEAAR